MAVVELYEPQTWGRKGTAGSQPGDPRTCSTPGAQGIVPAQSCQDQTSPGIEHLGWADKPMSSCRSGHPALSQPAVLFLPPKWVLGGPQAFFLVPPSAEGPWGKITDPVTQNSSALYINTHRGKQKVQPTSKMSRRRGRKGQHGEPQALREPQRDKKQDRRRSES